MADAAKQVSRSEADLQKRKTARTEKRKANEAWSDKSRKAEEREKRKEKRGLKKKWQSSQGTARGNLGEVTAGQKHTAPSATDEVDGEDDWDELAREERMAKKVKRGHVSQNEFDAEFIGL